MTLVWLPLLALLIWGKGGVLDLVALRRQVRDLQAEVQQLQDQNARLKEQIQTLQSDPSAYEAIARERLFLKKPGEVILYLPPSAGNPPAAPPSQPRVPASAPPAP